jgi:hypothetical protein
MSFLLADTVAKRFCASGPAILIQDQAAKRNVDFRESTRLDSIVAHSILQIFRDGFATVSALLRHGESAPRNQSGDQFYTECRPLIGVHSF